MIMKVIWLAFHEEKYLGIVANSKLLCGYVRMLGKSDNPFTICCNVIQVSVILLV